jgi:AcrR family transcriptional regulator
MRKWTKPRNRTGIGSVGMKKGKHIRQIERTNDLLSGAFFELIREKSYDAITVQAILDRSGIGRSTFYAHYRDKDDLFVAGLERMIDALTAQADNRGSHTDTHTGSHTNSQAIPLVPSLALFRHVQEQHDLYEALVWGPGVDLLFKHGQRYLSQKIVERINALAKDAARLAIPTSILAAFLAGTFLTLLKWWLDNKMIYSPEKMDEIYQRLATPAIATAGIVIAVGTPDHQGVP